MSLGFSRDSIVDLQSLVHHHEEDYTKAPSTINPSSCNTNEDFDDCDNDYSFIEGDSFVEEAKLQSLAPLDTKIEIPLTPTQYSLHRSPSTTSASSSSTTATIEEYSGFNYTYDDYYTDPYAVTNYDAEKDNVFCCLFPFLNKNDPPHHSNENDARIDSSEMTTITDQSNDSANNDIPIPTAKEPEKVVPKEITSETTTGKINSPHPLKRAAPTALHVHESKEDNSKDEDDGVDDTPLSSCSLSHESSLVLPNPNVHTSKPIKGILKKMVMRPPPSVKTNLSSSKDAGPSRRNILPTYESSSFRKESSGDFEDQSSTSKKKSLQFSTMARVMPVLPRSEMSFFTRSRIWWQRSDYEDFKKAGRIIAKAMVQGGSEIWLQTSDAWGKKQSNQVSSAKDSPEYLSAVKKYGVIQNVGEEKDTEEDIGHKWWCKFGHSRRGLEHIVSIQEGRQRQKLVNGSINAVLEEQRRQRATGRKDLKKLAAVSMQYTSWAKDLAIAAAAADAEAVQSNFHSKAKDRIEHLTSKLRSENVSQDGHTPCANFILAADAALKASLLDANIPKASVNPVTPKVTLQALREKDLAKKAAGFQYQESPVGPIA
jgi:hypothetical protein